MLVSNITTKSELYQTLSELGLLATEEKRIRTSRANINETSKIIVKTRYDDINRVGYFHPHFFTNLEYKDHIEVWVGSEYINPNQIEWLTDINHLYGILPKYYPEDTEVVLYYTPNMTHLFTQIEDDDEYHTYNYVADLTKYPYKDLAHPDKAIYYISENQIHSFEITQQDDTKIVLSCSYKHDIDVLLDTNLIGSFNVHANESFYLHNPYVSACYHHITVDNDPNYPIDARFYPCIRVDKDCFIRVYADSMHEVQYPIYSRLILYPEFAEVEDPYDTDNEYLKNLEPVEDIIDGDDTDDEILEKFKNIAKYCYRMWQQLPKFNNEQADFIPCDNYVFGVNSFARGKVYLTDRTIDSAIVSLVPFEPHRDLLFYNGEIYSDYQIYHIGRNPQGDFIETDSALECYLIDDPDIDVNKLTLIKFNAYEDTNFVNIGDYVDPNNIAELHTRLNRFYRNLMILRLQVLDNMIDDQVRVSTTFPSVRDEHVWFELLVNVIPEKFHINPIESIDFAGLDPHNVPDSIKTGAYNIEIEPDGGPTSYSEILMTYFKLSKGQKSYLALQYGEGQDDPRTKVYYDIHQGKESENEELNRVLIQDENMSPTEVRTSYEYGQPEDPGTGDHVKADLYFQTQPVPDPGHENISIDEIITGPELPTDPDEHTIYIETTPDGTTKDSLDGVIESVKRVNNPSFIKDPKVGDYVADAVNDDLTPEEEGEELLPGIEEESDEEMPDDFDNLLAGLDVDSDTEDAGDEFHDLDNVFEGITDAISKNITVESVENPIVGMFALDYIGDEPTRVATREEIHALTVEDKISLITKVIVDDDEPDKSKLADTNMWLQYFSSIPPGELDTIVEKILLTASVYRIVEAERGTIAIEGVQFDDEARKLVLGDYLSKVKPDEIIMRYFPKDPETGEVIPDYDVIKEANLKYIFSIYEPTVDAVADIGTLWLDIPAVTLEEYIDDVISETIYENGYRLPTGKVEGNKATMTFDYAAHGEKEVVGEYFAELRDPELHKVHYGETEPADMADGDIWYEFLDKIDGKICYSDMNTMIMRVNERLLAIEFGEKGISAYMFDDIVLNFKGRLGIKYLSILADLVNSGVVKLDELNMFWRRLITHEDHFDPRMKRLYIGTSYIVTTADIDTQDLSIVFSSNIGRFKMDYSSDETTNLEREAAYRMVIDYRKRDFGFIPDRMLLFVNGKYIPRCDYREDAAGMIQLTNFNEIIACVDIFYSKKDTSLMKAKKLTIDYWQIKDSSTSIHRPERDYKVMVPIDLNDYTYRGYYDVLIRELIFTGKLQRELNYLEEHPEEADEYITDLKEKFHAISDEDLTGMNLKDARIVISGNNDGSAYYTISE